MAQITIAASTVPNWYRDSGSPPDAQLRIYALDSFVTSDNKMIEGGPFNPDDASQNNNWYQLVTGLTWAAGVLSIPSLVLPSTTDSQDNPSATYAAAFFSNEGDFICWFFEFQDFIVPAAPTSTTWAAIALAQGGTP